MCKKWKSFLLISKGGLIFALMFSVWIGCQSSIDEAKYAVTQKKIAEIETALSLYAIEVGEYPSIEQGLDALWRPPNPTPQNWAGPYVQYRVSTDPWDNSYVYRNPGTRLGYEYDLLSYGRDGKPGGVGLDADIWVGETTREVNPKREVDPNSIYLLLYIALIFVFGIATASVGVRKGRNRVAWFFIGVILGPIGLIISLCLPKKQKCPYCGELVKAEAIKCRFCDESLQDTMQ